MRCPHLHKDDVPLLLLALVKVLLHFGVNLRDGYFIDEFYYIACGERLDWGYVDHPPLVAVIAAATRFLLGDSVFALRVPAVLAGAAMVFFAGRLARELGGGRFAQVLAALAVFAVPVFTGVHGIYSMNAFDQLIWLLGAYLIVLIIHHGRPLHWLLFGLLMGIGLMNKISVLFFGMGLAMGILLTPNRRWLRERWIWTAAVIAFLIFLPHILWQIAYGWPTLEFIHNASTYKNLPLSPLEFLMGHFLEMNHLLIPLTLAGLVWCFGARKGKPYRILAWIYIAVLALMIAQKGKTYYAAPALSLILIPGAAAVEQWIARGTWTPARRAAGVAILLYVMIAIGLMAPFVIPILPTETYIRYAAWLGIQPSTGERKEIGKLPQFFADRQGWPEMVETIARIYNALPPEDKAECVIYAGMYGQAGAINLLGKPYGLPRAITAHNSYFLWGPGEKRGDVVLAYGVNQKNLEALFEDIQEAARFTHPYVMPYENNLPVFVCRKPKVSLREIWPEIKHYE
ncbi:MAG: ArnT family glycosyltransferase [bacterium]